MQLRRLGTGHWTDYDHLMDRIDQAQRKDVYARRLAQLENSGWVPFSGPFYFARREFHGGHFMPDSRRRVPTGVAFAMFREANPDVVLEPYPPHPHGWTPPPTTWPLFQTTVVSVQPMSMPKSKLFDLKVDYGFNTDSCRDRWKVFCSQFEGVRSSSVGFAIDPTTRQQHNVVSVLLEHDKDADKFPKEWEGCRVDVSVRSEVSERAVKEAEDRELLWELEWARKAKI